MTTSLTPPTDTLSCTNQQSQPPTTVLVDTSLLIEQLKRERSARPVREALAPFYFKGASSYSKLEFKRAWLQRLAYLHDVCSKPGVDSVVDVIDWVNRKLSNQPFRRGSLQTCLDMLTRFFDLNSDAINKPAQLAKLRAHCKRSVLDGTAALLQLITAEFKGTRCNRAEEPATENADGSLNVTVPKCQPHNAKCAIVEFFVSNKAAFSSLANHVDTLPDASKEMKNMQEHIRLALADPRHLCQAGNCARVADAIIALDGRQMAVFAANNDREWVHISNVLHKPLLNPLRHNP